jgi:hypothetical protein
MPSPVKCPYCRASISSDAAVCSQCTRDVGRLIEAERELLRRPKPAPDNAAADDRRGARAIIPTYYILATVVFSLAFEDQLSASIAGPLLLWLPLLAGAALGYLRRPFNLPRWLLLGFAQPVVTLVLFVTFDDSTELDAIRPILLAIFREAAQRAVLFAGGGLLVALAAKGVSSTEPPIEWLGGEDVDLDRIEKLALKIVAIATPLVSLASLVASKMVDK